jgi:hypothetical protein
MMNTLIQSVAALLIFVVGYFALLLSAIAALVIGHLIYKGGRLFWSRLIQPALSANGVLSKFGLISHHVAAVRRPGL